MIGFSSPRCFEIGAKALVLLDEFLECGAEDVHLSATHLDNCALDVTVDKQSFTNRVRILLV